MLFKRFSKVFGILLLICLMSALVLGACSGAKKASRLRSYGMYSEREIILPIKSDYVLEGEMFIGLTSFHSKQDLDELKEIAEKVCNVVKVETFRRVPNTWVEGDSILLLRDNGDGTNDYFNIVITKKESKKYVYQLNSLRGEVVYENAEKEKSTFWNLLPLHLISNYKRSQGLYMDTDYITSGSLKDFYEFYAGSGRFELEKRDGEILINGFKPDAENNSIGSDLPFKYKIVFRNNIDITLFKLVRAE